jgi:hypothetical protein
MWMTVVVHYQHPFDCLSHSEIFIVVLETLEARRYGGVFFGLGLFCTVCRMLVRYIGYTALVFTANLNVKLESGYLHVAREYLGHNEL